MNYLESLNQRIPSFPSIVAREFNLVRALEHIPAVMPNARIVGATAITSESEEVSRKVVDTGVDTVSTVNRNKFKAKIEDPGRDSPLDVAITGKTLVDQADEHNPDARAWTIKSLALVTPPLISHECFDNLESVVRTLNAHKTLGRSARFTGVMHPYYVTKDILRQMGLWTPDVMPAYRPRGIMKTHKILGKTNEGLNIGYADLFSDIPVAIQYFEEATRRNTKLLDVGIPEPIFTKSEQEYRLGQTNAIVFDLQKNNQRVATILGPDIPIYTFSHDLEG